MIAIIDVIISVTVIIATRANLAIIGHAVYSECMK